MKSETACYDCYDCDRSIARIHRHPSGEWLVPSRTVPDRFYTVATFPSGAVQCSCPWGSSLYSTSLCWHARLILAYEEEGLVGVLPKLCEARDLAEAEGKSRKARSFQFAIDALLDGARWPNEAEVAA
jgi:hypothetical protein